MHRLFLVLISLVSFNGFAADVENLYQSQLPVLSQSEQERTKLAPDILKKVLLKVVGDADRIDSTNISTILAQAETLVQQYQYLRTNTISEDLTEPEHLQLALSFKQAEVNQLLMQNNLPIWGRARPESLFWIAVEDKGQRTLINADEQTALIANISAAADERGLPILFPLMDLQDQSQVNVSDVWAGFSQTIEPASQRYDSAVIVMLAVKKQANDYLQLQWHVLINDELIQWQSTGSSITTIQSGINELANHLAQRFSSVATGDEGEQRLSLTISDVQGYADYIRITRYLNNVQNVSDVKITQFAANTMTVKLSYGGQLAILKRTLDIDHTLLPAAYSSSADELIYQLAP